MPWRQIGAMISTTDMMSRLLHTVTITVMSLWARYRLKSPASRLFTQTFIQAQTKERNSSTSLAFKFRPAEMASNAENASIWWRHHDSSHFTQYIYRPTTIKQTMFVRIGVVCKPLVSLFLSRSSSHCVYVLFYVISVIEVSFSDSQQFWISLVQLMPKQVHTHQSAKTEISLESALLGSGSSNARHKQTRYVLNMSISLVVIKKSKRIVIVSLEISMIITP